GEKDSGDGDNASDLSRIFDTAFEDIQVDASDNGNIGENIGTDKSINSFYGSLIGELGVNAENAKRQAGNTEILRAQVDNQRMSVSAVSLDEEMSNMIQFQHAYNAAARSMTTIDEMLDKIINGMGIVGR